MQSSHTNLISLLMYKTWLLNCNLQQANLSMLYLSLHMDINSPNNQQKTYK